MQVRFSFFVVLLFVFAANVSPLGLPTTSSVSLTDDEIARMNAEASAAASRFGNLGVMGQVAAVAKAATVAITNPLTTIYSLVAPLGMFAYGFVDQAFQSVKNTDYMGSTLSIMVDPKAQWQKLLAAESAAISKVAGLQKAQTSSTPTVPTAQDLEASGWSLKYKEGPVGLVYDFGFAGAGEDMTQPFGFLRSLSTGKYYYRPVRGKMSPASVAIQGKPYTVDFRKRPFNVLVPKLMLSLVGEKVAAPLWNTMLDFTQLDPIKIFVFKSILLFSSAIKNSFQRVETKTTDAGQVYAKSSWGSYKSVDKGANYPVLSNIHTELAKLVQRLKVTPDIKRTIKANNGQTYPSKWDPSKIVYLGDVNPGLILLSALPGSLKYLLNNLFKVSVNFYEYQAAIDSNGKMKPSDIEKLYGFIRSYELSEEIIKQVQQSNASGKYVDGYILKLQELQNRISGILWKGGTQSFTDMMRLFFLLRWMLKDIYTGIEFVVSRYEQPEAVLAGDSSESISAGADVDAGLQDQSVAPERMVGDSYAREIDYDLLNKSLGERVAALKQYAAFVRTYVDSFVANSIGDSSIDARYVRTVPSKDLTSFAVEEGGADDLSTYFPPVVMKKTLKDYVATVGKEADAALAGIDSEINSLSSLIVKASAASASLKQAQVADGIPASSVLNAAADTSDALISELRKRVANAQAFGLYPLGYDEKYLKTVELPGAVYLAYSLNYQARLLSRPFEGDALAFYDDSFYDDDSSYLYLVSVLLRANEDLSRAGAVVSAINGPVEFKDASGKKYTVPNGSEFYLNSLKKYDQYYLLQEQNLRKVEAASGKASPEYQAALTNYSNAHKLLIQKKREMNNLLRTFEFDRRKGATYTPVSVSTAQALSLADKASDRLVGGGGAVTTGVSSGQMNVALDAKTGVVGRLDDGAAVYSYERSVLGFLQSELARFAFRARMLNLNDLKELVFAVTGIQAEDLWAGVEARKRALFYAQQVAADAAKQQVQAVVSDVSLDDLLSDDSASQLEGFEGVSDDSQQVLVEEVAGANQGGQDLVANSSNSVGGAEGSSVSGAAGSVATAAVPPVDTEQSQGLSASQQTSNTESVTSSAAPSGVSSSDLTLSQRPASLVEDSDLDAVVFGAASAGKSSFNDAAGITMLNTKLANLFAQGQAAAGAKDGQMFTAYIVKIVGLAGQAIDPSDDVKLTFVSALQQATSLLAFNGEVSKFADVNSFDNMLQVVAYLKHGILASQSSALSVMEGQLGEWLKSH